MSNFPYLWKRLKRNYTALFGGGYILFLIFVSFFGHKISPDNSLNANHQNLNLRFKGPGHKKEISLDTTLLNFTSIAFNKKSDLAAPSYRDVSVYYLGTDGLGRDVLSRLLIGTKVSMLVGLISVLVSLIIGVSAGSLAGYYGHWIDKCILWTMNVFWAIPTVLLAMVFLMSTKVHSAFQLWLVFLAVGFTMWVDTARLIRGLFLQFKNKQFVQAAEVLGYSDLRIIFYHILPNTLPSLIVITASNFAAAILMEAGLSYLGLGIQPPAPSWGSMLREYYGYIGTDASYLAFFPGIAITLAVLSFNAMGNFLRDIMDIKG